MTASPCNIITFGSGSWRCTACGLVGDTDENHEDHCNRLLKSAAVRDLFEKAPDAPEDRTADD